MNLFRSPGLTLANTVLLNLTVVVIATIAYLQAEWTLVVLETSLVPLLC